MNAPHYRCHTAYLDIQRVDTAMNAGAFIQDAPGFRYSGVDTAIMRCIHTGRATPGFRYSGVDTAIMRCIHTGRAGFRYSGVDTAIMRCIHSRTPEYRWL